MRNFTNVSLMAVLLLASCAGDGETPTRRIAASARAAEHGVWSYEVDAEQDLVVRMLGKDGSEVGALEFVAIEAEPLGQRDETRFGADDERHPYDQRLRVREADGSRRDVVDVARFTPVYVDTVRTAWQAAVIDPALAEILFHHGLMFAEGKSPELTNALEGGMAYSGEYPCCGFNVNEDSGHVFGSPYMGCGGNCSTTFQMWNMGQYSSCKWWIHGLTRICDSNCCAGSCSNPSGPSPCGAPYGGGGCYVSGSHWDDIYCFTQAYYCEPECQPPEP